MDPTRPPAAARLAIGARGEQLVADRLRDLGLEVVARNWRLSAGPVRGELDLVALDHTRRMVVVCEVKTRTGDGFGGALLAVTPRKQAQIRRLTAAFLRDAALPYGQVRFDVAAVRLDRRPPTIDHVRAAF